MEDRETVLICSHSKECVSSRAKRAIGVEDQNGSTSLDLREGHQTDIVLYGLPQEAKTRRVRSTVDNVIYDAGPHRITIKNGYQVSQEQN